MYLYNWNYDSNCFRFLATNSFNICQYFESRMSKNIAEILKILYFNIVTAADMVNWR